MTPKEHKKLLRVSGIIDICAGLAMFLIIKANSTYLSNDMQDLLRTFGYILPIFGALQVIISFFIYKNDGGRF